MTQSVLFAVALGGGLGAVCRAACTNLIKTRWKRSVPLATFCISVARGRMAEATWSICFASFPRSAWSKPALISGSFFNALIAELSPLAFWIVDRLFMAEANCWIF